MPPEPVIEVSTLTKTYRIWDRPASRLTAPLLEGVSRLFPANSSFQQTLRKKAAAKFRDFYALRDVSSAISPGESTGIIGRNGSGKSTLLQLIAGTLAPTKGAAKVRGRVSALLELGSGFNPDFTGRENVFLNGAIYGFTHSEMTQRMLEIMEFADIGDFIGQPVKTYSSGMMMRLAFAIAVHVQPDVLIIDEALAVGDVFFSQKCFQRIRDMVKHGATLLFVSHDMGAVQSLCDRAILLSQGNLVFDGVPEDCVSRYFTLHKPLSGPAHRGLGSHPSLDPVARSSVIRRQYSPVSEIAARGPGARDRGRGHRRSAWRLCLGFRNDASSGSAYATQSKCGHQKTALPASRSTIGWEILCSQREPHSSGSACRPCRKARRLGLEFRITLNLQTGVYTLSLDAAEFDEENPNVGIFYDRIGGLGPMNVAHHGSGALPFYGMAQLPMEINYL